MNFQFIENDGKINDSLKVLNELTVAKKSFLTDKTNSSLYQLKDFKG